MIIPIMSEFMNRHEVAKDLALNYFSEEADSTFMRDIVLEVGTDRFREIVISPNPNGLIPNKIDPPLAGEYVTLKVEESTLAAASMRVPQPHPTRSSLDEYCNQDRIRSDITRIFDTVELPDAEDSEYRIAALVEHSETDWSQEILMLGVEHRARYNPDKSISRYSVLFFARLLDDFFKIPAVDGRDKSVPCRRASKIPRALNVPTIAMGIFRSNHNWRLHSEIPTNPPSSYN
jgi:hypothetical protein